MKYQPVIGLEVHIELKTKSKMFCRCSANHFAKLSNIYVCPVCLGLPGALPVPNQKAIEWCVLAGLALNCQVPLFSKFDRKNYFYPDLPKGYQISQYDQPFSQKGWLKIGERRVGITRVHLEEDTAKLIHRGGSTLIDFNRSGVPLMEIVSEPDIQSPNQAKAYLKKLQQIIRYLGISDGDMEKGSMRCEANISLKKCLDRGYPCQGLPLYKVEIKNLNSFRFLEKALNYEIARQTKLLQVGKKPIQETRGWNQAKQITFSQRIKETAADYRYFPEPDIPPIRWNQFQITKLKSQIPELPDEKIKRFIEKYGLSEYQIEILIATREKADYFEKTVKTGKKHGVSALKIANIIINKRIDIKQYLPSELIQILVKKQTSQVTTLKTINNWVKQALVVNQKAIKDYKDGKKQALTFLIGQVQRLAKGKADPKITKEILKRNLKK